MLYGFAVRCHCLCWGLGPRSLRALGLLPLGCAVCLASVSRVVGMRLLLSVCMCVLVTCGVCEQAFEHEMSLLAPYLSKPKARNTEAKKP